MRIVGIVFAAAMVLGTVSNAFACTYQSADSGKKDNVTAANGEYPKSTPAGGNS